MITLKSISAALCRVGFVFSFLFARKKSTGFAIRYCSGSSIYSLLNWNSSSELSEARFILPEGRACEEELSLSEIPWCASCRLGCSCPEAWSRARWLPVLHPSPRRCVLGLCSLLVPCHRAKPEPWHSSVCPVAFRAASYKEHPKPCAVPLPCTPDCTPVGEEVLSARALQCTGVAAGRRLAPLL